MALLSCSGNTQVSCETTEDANRLTCIPEFFWSRDRYNKLYQESGPYGRCPTPSLGAPIQPGDHRSPHHSRFAEPWACAHGSDRLTRAMCWLGSRVHDRLLTRAAPFLLVRGLGIGSTASTGTGTTSACFLRKRGCGCLRTLDSPATSCPACSRAGKKLAPSSAFARGDAPRANDPT